MNILRKMIKKCPLAVCILCSWAVLAAAGYLPQSEEETADGQQTGDTSDKVLDDGVDYDTLNGVTAAKHAPELALEGAGETKKQGTESGEGIEPETGGPGDTSKAYGGADAGHSEGQGRSAATGTEPEKIKPEYISYKKKQTDSPWYTDPGKIPLTTACDYAKVDEDYFDDAVFIGDSRIVGMNDYSGLTNASFFAKTGLTVYDLLDDKFIKDPGSGKKVSVSYMMQHYTYGKIYLMVGINELGTGGTDRFQEAYRNVLKKFRKWQPDAVIYVQSIMGVSPKKDKTDEVFNNTNIRDKNYAISRLTDGIHIFYLNIQELYEDKNHNLSQELTFDDVHLYAQHYDKWVEFLKEHAVMNEPEGEEK